MKARILRPSPLLSVTGHHPAPTSGGDWLKPQAIEIDQTPSPIVQANPDRYGVYIQNVGGKLEIPIPLGPARVGAPLPLFAFIDSGSVNVAQYAAGSTYKSLALVVDVAISAGAGQSKVQLLVGRDRWGPSAGAASGVGIANALKGAAVNWGPAGGTIPVGMTPFSPADMADLQWSWPWLGLELQMFAAVTAGSARLLLELPTGPNVFLGTDRSIESSATGDRANSFALAPGAAPLFLQTDREIWAAAAPGGIADLRIWQVLYHLPTPAEYPVEHG